jgi:glycosyltransferase involved in cell wall biosynthesis
MSGLHTQVVVLVPVYNEGERLFGVLDGIVKSSETWNCSWRAEVLDDGSLNWPEAYDRRICERGPVSIRHFGHNRGKGAVLSEAFHDLDCDYCVVIDADGEYDPGDIPRLLRPLVDGEADFVFGSRYGFGRPRPRQYGAAYGANRLFNFTFGCLSGVWLRDLLTGLYGFRTCLVDGIRLEQARFAYTPELLWRIQRRWKPRWVEVPVSYRFRTYREGKSIRWWEAFTILGCLVRYRFIPRVSGPVSLGKGV